MYIYIYIDMYIYMYMYIYIYIQYNYIYIYTYTCRSLSLILADGGRARLTGGVSRFFGTESISTFAWMYGQGFHLPESGDKVVLQKSIPAQIRQLILYIKG